MPGEPSGKEQPATEGAGEGWDEEQSKSANRVCGDPATWWVATEVFQLVLFLILLCSEVNLSRQEEERNTEADGQQQKETIRQQRQDLGRHVGEV